LRVSILTLSKSLSRQSRKSWHFQKVHLNNLDLSRRSRHKSQHDLVSTEKVSILKISTEKIQNVSSTVEKISTFFNSFSWLFQKSRSRLISTVQTHMLTTKPTEWKMEICECPCHNLDFSICGLVVTFTHRCTRVENPGGGHSGHLSRILCKKFFFSKIVNKFIEMAKNAQKVALNWNFFFWGVKNVFFCYIFFFTLKKVPDFT
jgi:hypothetical protein